MLLALRPRLVAYQLQDLIAVRNQERPGECHHARRQLVADPPACGAALAVCTLRCRGPLPASAMENGSAAFAHCRLSVLLLHLVGIVPLFVIGPIKMARQGTDRCVGGPRWISAGHLVQSGHSRTTNRRPRTLYRAARNANIASRSLAGRCGGALGKTCDCYWTLSSFATEPFFFGSVSSRMPLLHFASALLSSTSCI